jgi:hypothetical protein
VIGQTDSEAVQRYSERGCLFEAKREYNQNYQKNLLADFSSLNFFLGFALRYAKSSWIKNVSISFVYSSLSFCGHGIFNIPLG